MDEFWQTLLTACIPAILTGIGSFVIAIRKSKSELNSLKEQNAHDIEKLMEQHEIDIDALKEKYRLEAEAKEKEHQYKLELLQKESENTMAKDLMLQLMAMPEIKSQISQGIRNSQKRKGSN